MPAEGQGLIHMTATQGGHTGEQALRQQALRLTQSVYLKMRTKPTQPAEKVAPIVYLLLKQGTPVDHIELALKEAKSLTPAGIDYTLATLVPKQTGMNPKIEPIAPARWDPPTEAEKARVGSIISSTRQALRGR